MALVYSCKSRPSCSTVSWGGSVSFQQSAARSRSNGEMSAPVTLLKQRVEPVGKVLLRGTGRLALLLKLPDRLVVRLVCQGFLLLRGLKPGGGLFYLAVNLAQSLQPGQALLYRKIEQRGQARWDVGNGDIQGEAPDALKQIYDLIGGNLPVGLLLR